MSETDRVLALGFFDGVHIGHKALLDTVNQRAKTYSLLPSILNFDTHPDNLLHGNRTPLLYSSEKRRKIFLQEFGISDIILLHFDAEMMKTEWDVFLDSLIEEYHVRWLVAGYDFRFGYQGKGTAEKLNAYCLEREIGCDIVPAVVKNGEVVRSNLIRTCILDGEMDRAAMFLGRHYSIDGIVQKGYSIGTKIGFPTVNLLIPDGQIIPRHGVYATRTILNGESYPSITNVGVRPTFSDSGNVTVETNIFDFQGSVYKNSVEIEFYSFIREERHFSDPAELTAQIREDIRNAEEILNKA